MVSLIVVAGLGNTTGAIVNWFIGLGINKSIMRFEKFPASSQYWTIIGWYKKYGQWTLLLSWAPLIGDHIAIVAGVFKIPFKVFLFYVALAKTSRYIFIAIFMDKVASGSKARTANIILCLLTIFSTL